MGRTYEDSPIVKTVKRLLDAQTKLFEQKVADVQGYTAGVTDQLMLQQGQAMTVQAGILEWLDKNFGKPGFTPSDQIAAIVEANVAKARAEREAEAKRKAAEQDAQAKPAEPLHIVTEAEFREANPDAGPLAFEGDPPNIAPATPADAASPDAAGST